MKLLGSRILNQRKVLATRRAGWRNSFEIDAEYRLGVAPLTDDELAAMLYGSQSLQPLEMLPLQWDNEDFQLAHRDRLGRTETFYSFSREMNYTGSPGLWSYAPFRGYDAPLTARRSKDDQLFIEGYCTGPEREIIDDVLRSEVELLERGVRLQKPHIEEYDADLETAIEHWIRGNSRRIAEWRESYSDRRAA